MLVKSISILLIPLLDKIPETSEGMQIWILVFGIFSILAGGTSVITVLAKNRNDLKKLKLQDKTSLDNAKLNAYLDFLNDTMKDWMKEYGEMTKKLLNRYMEQNDDIHKFNNEKVESFIRMQQENAEQNKRIIGQIDAQNNSLRAFQISNIEKSNNILNTIKELNNNMLTCKKLLTQDSK